MTKPEIIEELNRRGIPHDAASPKADLDALLAANPVPQRAAQVNTAAFGWAVNLVKLNRAKAQVKIMQPSLSGSDLESAVRARYEELGGLVRGDFRAPMGKPKGQVENVADDDGSDD